MPEIEIDYYFDNLVKILETEPDFKDMVESKEFKRALLADNTVAYHVLRGKRFTLHGDIRSIHIGQFGAMCIALTINNEFNGINTSTEVRVDVSKDLYEKVMKLRPDTGVELKVKYKKFDVVVDTFELIEVTKHSNSLYFPYCVCTGDNIGPNSGTDRCHRILGYTKNEYSDHCPYCGSNTKKCNNAYTDEFLNLIEINKRGIIF